MKRGFLLLVALIFFGGIMFAGTLRITAPNGGETWELGSRQNITWVAEGTFANPVKITLFKNGVRLGLIAGNVNANDQTFLWERAGEYQAGGVGGTRTMAIAGTGYIIKIKEQRVETTAQSERVFTFNSTYLDLTVTDVFKDQLANLIVKVKCLRGNYSGWCLLRAENPNMPRGGFKAKMHNLNLRSGQEQTYTLGSFTPQEWLAIFQAERSVCNSAYIKGIVDANNQITESNEDNNSLRRYVYLRYIDGQIVPPIGIGKFERRVMSNQEIIVRPSDIESRETSSGKEYVALKVKVNVRNCGSTPISNYTLNFEQKYDLPGGQQGSSIDVRMPHTINVEPGKYETYRRTVMLTIKSGGRATTNNTLDITLALPLSEATEPGTADANNHCRIKLKFEGF